MKRRLQSPSIEDVSSKDEPIQSRKRAKRPRTEKYLQQKAIYEDVLHSCKVFQTELSKLINNDDDCLDDSVTAHPSRRGIVKSTEQNLQRQVQKYEEKFLTTCQELKKEAKQTIDLSYGFGCLTRAIDAKEQPTSNDDKACILSILNLGYETTSTIKLRIAEYAGVASGDQLDDMKSLALQLRSDGR